MIKLKKPPITLNCQVVGCHEAVMKPLSFLVINSTSTTVVEVTTNIHDTLIMPHDSQCQSQPHDRLT